MRRDRAASATHSAGISATGTTDDIVGRHRRCAGKNCLRNRATNIILGMEGLTLDLIKVLRNVEIIEEGEA